MDMKKNIMWILLVILMCGSVTGAAVEIVPRGESVEVRHTTNWDIYDEDNYLVNQNPDPAEPGGYVELRFKVENIGGENANNVIFELIPVYPFSLYGDISAVRTIGDMYMSQVGEDAFILYYKLRVDKDAIEGNNPIRLRYTTDGGMTWSRDEFDVRVQTHDAILDIESVKLEPEEIAPGGISKLTINLDNMADSLLKDVKVNLGVLREIVTSTSVISSELPFTPIGSTNEKTIEYIDAFESKNITFDLIADSDASSGIYKLPIKIEYSDELGENYTKQQYTSIVVGEKPDIIISIEDSEIITSKQAGTVSVKFTNKGTSDIKFLYIEMMQSEKYDIISSEKVYVGNIDSDDYETADFKLYVKGTRNKNVQLPLKLEYKDANNKLFKKDFILNLRIYSSSEAKRYGLMKVSSPMGSIIFFLVVLFGVWYYFKRKKKIDLLRLLIDNMKEMKREKNLNLRFWKRR